MVRGLTSSKLSTYCLIFGVFFAAIEQKPICRCSNRYRNWFYGSIWEIQNKHTGEDLKEFRDEILASGFDLKLAYGMDKNIDTSDEVHREAVRLRRNEAQSNNKK